MRRFLAILAAVVAYGLAFGRPAGAQEIGDRVRVRLGPDLEWLEGRLIDYSQSEISIRGVVTEGGPSTFDVSAVDQADLYAPTHIAKGILGGLAGSALFLMLSPCDPLEGTCIGGSKGGHAAASIGLGVAAGLIVHLVNPGTWRSWIEDGVLVN